MAQNKKLYIKTYGCQMNVYDSERIAEMMAHAGYESVSSPDNADMILLNTCHIREKAAEKIYSELGKFQPFKAKNAALKIGVVGCVAQAEGSEIAERQPLVDLIVGPQSYHRLPAMLDRLSKDEKAIDTDFPVEDKFAHLPSRKNTAQRPSAFLTVQEGCDKFCAFCVVPYTRGAENSREPERIYKEAQILVEQGARELILLGQNVNAYKACAQTGKIYSLADLIYMLAEIDGLKRIRFTTSHPNDMQDDLIDAFGACSKLMPYLHLPVQSGSNKILKAMNRNHTAESYIRLIERIRRICPDILLSGDFIVGFPEEDEKDFDDTLSLVDEINYGQAYSFKYSPRPGTPAARRAQIDETTKSARLARLQTLLGKQQSNNLKDMVSRCVPVLLEKSGRNDGQLVGKTSYLQMVCVDAPLEYIGRIVDVTVNEAGRNVLFGSLVNDAKNCYKTKDERRTGDAFERSA